MGLSLKNLVSAQEISIQALQGKRLAVDSYNLLYQFITTIRMADGSPLKDSKGNITSHLQGLFLRSAKVLSEGAKLIFVFDGEPPKLKKKELSRRADIKTQAKKKYDTAKDSGDIESMKKYAGRTSRLTEQMVDEAKRLCRLMGCPVIDAPSEGEAQASHMVKKGDVYATVSQDFDSLLFGSERLVRNLSVLGKRKKTSVLGYTKITPEMIVLSDFLNKYSIDREMLIVAAILIGTDYNYGGVMGIGPKKAMKMLKEHGKDYDKIFSQLEWNFDFSWRDVFDTIKNIPVSDDYKLDFPGIDSNGIMKFLCEERDFSKEMVEKTLAKLDTQDKSQKSIFDF